MAVHLGLATAQPGLGLVRAGLPPDGPCPRLRRRPSLPKLGYTRRPADPPGAPPETARLDLTHSPVPRAFRTFSPPTSASPRMTSHERAGHRTFASGTIPACPSGRSPPPEARHAASSTAC